MIAADLALRWIHILGAIVLVGGTFFMWSAYLPAAHAESGSLELMQAIRRRWAKCVMAASGLLLLSGLVNVVRIVGRYEIDDAAFPGSLYHMLLSIKVLLALGVFVLSAALSGRSKLAVWLRGNEKLWYSVNLTLAVLIVLLAGMLKSAGRTEKTAQLIQPVKTQVSFRLVVRTDERLPSVATHSWLG
jgi:uncharacterized membrane protein